MRQCLIALVVAGLLAAGAAPVSANRVGFDLFLGNSWHMNEPIRVGDHIIDDPQWVTKPFEGALYYSARIRWGTLEVEWLHDKVYMGYDTPSVKGFNMSDGYNFLLLNYVQTWGPWEGRLGAGPMILHPEGVVDGYEIGYTGSPSWRVGGVGFQASAAYRSELWGDLSYIVEAKLTKAIVHLEYPEPVKELYAPVSAAHLLLGVGYDF